MVAGLPERLLTDRITVRRSVQSLVPSTKKPVFQFEVFVTGLPARFNPANTALDRNVLGQTPKKTFRLFLNPGDLKENDEVINEATNEVFIAREVKNFFGHHMEAILEEKR